MVGHEAIRVEKERQLVFLNCEKRKKLSVVITAVEDRLPVISAGDDMIETTCDLNSGFPRHAADATAQPYRRQHVLHRQLNPKNFTRGEMILAVGEWRI